MNHALEAYASEPSVAPGGTLHLRVSTAPAAPYLIRVYRLGWYGGSGARLVACMPSDCVATEQGRPQPLPSPDPSTGLVRANWPVTDSIRIERNWTSGYYAARLISPDGGQVNAVLFVVTDPPTERSQILVEVPVNTWEAYNSWGGKSLYNFNSDGQVPANRVSFDRPWAPGSQSQFFAWGIQLVRFLEREGYDVSYTTDVDVDRDPAELQRHALVIVNGHGEYWTGRMRDAFDAARNAGVNLAFIGANIGYWQVRYEDDRRTVVGYKELPDPVMDPALRTTLFRLLAPSKVECALLGVQHQGSLRRSGMPPVDYTVNPAALSDPWFAGTGFTATSVLPDLVGPEWDQVVSPHLAPACKFSNLTVFFHHEGTPGNADAVRYVARSGARVFSAGSLQFAWGLDTFLTEERGHTAPADPRLQQFMRNALADLTSPPLPDPFGPP